jgi:predicted NUDIX family NTP pyrophosphohydrolase
VAIHYYAGFSGKKKTVTASMRQSAGILLFRRGGSGPEFFLVHPGGPFWQNKDAGAWTIPKGGFTNEEEPLAAAQREFAEETGTVIKGNFIPLQPVKQKAGKMVYAWAVEGDIDAAAIVSNTFKAEWPYKSGKWNTYPEVDKGGWYSFEEACLKINPAQVSFLLEIKKVLGF